MGWLFGTWGCGILSALIPLINIEAYLAAVATRDDVHIWPLAIAAAIGQMMGKIVYYYLGRSSLDWAWVRRKTSSERFQAALERWRLRIGERPMIAALVLFASATVGLPPFAVLSVIAGTLRVPLTLFVSVGLVGRVLRFATILGAVGWLVS